MYSLERKGRKEDKKHKHKKYSTLKATIYLLSLRGASEPFVYTCLSAVIVQHNCAHCFYAGRIVWQ